VGLAFFMGGGFDCVQVAAGSRHVLEHLHGKSLDVG
jgi:hypothetical protein